MSEEIAMRRVVEHIFNNWTALQLAVEHSMGGPDSKKVALDFLDYTVNYCLNDDNTDVGSIQEVLEDILDEEFETICEDGSTQQIAAILNKFLELIKAGNVTLYEEEYKKLPVTNEWLVKSQSTSFEVQPKVVPQETIEEANTSSSEAQMEVDPDWTEVKSRRKR